ncbi:hypothetical protein M758_12G042300 [Ceratodon purpureus]|nr:hypothetical protein M758_12G042300 [Ceratodon purpureus]
MRFPHTMWSLFLRCRQFRLHVRVHCVQIYQSDSLNEIFRLASLWILPMTQQASTMSVWTTNSVNVVGMQQQHHHQSLQEYGKRVHG